MILATYREPFGFAPHVCRLPQGETLARMRARMSGLPDDFDARGVICLNGHPVARDLWGMVRPKAPAITEVTFHCPPQGGGDGGKNPLATIASIALMAVSRAGRSWADLLGRRQQVMPPLAPTVAARSGAFLTSRRCWGCLRALSGSGPSCPACRFIGLPGQGHMSLSSGS